MSSICQAMTIVSQELSRCMHVCNEQYCDIHEHQYRFQKPDECAICTDTISNITEIPLHCGHWIHKACIIPTNLHKCPFCQTTMTMEEITYVFGVHHVEHNIYNDGTSIYWNPQETDHEFDEEFEQMTQTDLSNGSYPVLNYFQENNQPLEEIIVFNRPTMNATHVDIVDVMESLQFCIDNVCNDINENMFYSQYIDRTNILSTIPVDEADEYVNSMASYIRNKITSLINQYENGIHNYHIQDIDNLIFHVDVDLRSMNEFRQTYALLYNFNRMSECDYMRNPIELMSSIVNDIIIEALDLYRI